MHPEDAFLPGKELDRALRHELGWRLTCQLEHEHRVDMLERSDDTWASAGNLFFWHHKQLRPTDKEHE